jgi:hypothetical protein
MSVDHEQADGRHDFDFIFGPWQGLTLRQFDPATRLWHIWWTQSFSFDDGRTWVPNWVMEFRRP